MTPDLAKLARRIAGFIPGTESNTRSKIATEKRQLEKALRADGWSRSQAKIAVAVRFNGAKQ